MSALWKTSQAPKDQHRNKKLLVNISDYLIEAVTCAHYGCDAFLSVLCAGIVCHQDLSCWLSRRRSRATGPSCPASTLLRCSTCSTCLPARPCLLSCSSALLLLLLLLVVVMMMTSSTQAHFVLWSSVRCVCVRRWCCCLAWRAQRHRHC